MGGCCSQKTKPKSTKGYRDDDDDYVDDVTRNVRQQAATSVYCELQNIALEENYMCRRCSVSTGEAAPTHAEHRQQASLLCRQCGKLPGVE